MTNKQHFRNSSCVSNTLLAEVSFFGIIFGFYKVVHVADIRYDSTHVKSCSGKKPLLTVYVNKRLSGVEKYAGWFLPLSFSKSKIVNSSLRASMTLEHEAPARY